MNHQETLKKNSLSHECEYCNIKFNQLISLSVIKLNYFILNYLKFNFFCKINRHIRELFMIFMILKKN